eukprot:Rmarinus@m.23757
MLRSTSGSLRLVGRLFSKEVHQKAFASLDVPGAVKEAKELLCGLAKTVESPTVMCHNDLLAGNILVDCDSGDLMIIDYEYMSWNFRGFDLANHFCEYAGGTDNGNPDYSLFPDEPMRRQFLTVYLKAFKESVSDTEVTSLCREVDIFTGLAHMYWLLWAVVQQQNDEDSTFPYLTYAINRFRQLSTNVSL